MTKPEIRATLANCLKKESKELDLPTERDWTFLKSKFNTDFNQDFVAFIELMTEFSFPGDVLNVVRQGRSNGNDTIDLVYDFEMEHGDWDPDLIPFYSVGNGDYFVLKANEGSTSAVYYRYHENGHLKKYSASFEEWIKQLPDFLSAA